MRAVGWRETLRSSAVLVGLAAGGGTALAQGPAGAAGQSAAPPQEAALDLAHAQAGGVTRLTVPRGQFLLLVSHRAPSATYRVRSSGPEATENSFFGVDPAQFRFDESPAGCAAWAEVLQAFLREGDEAGMPARIAQVDRASGESACPTARPMAGITTLAAAQFGPLTVAVGGRTSLTVERLDAAQGVVKAWQVEVEGPAREPDWSRGSESEWLVAEVLSDVARLVEFAKRGTLGTGALEARPVDGVDQPPRFSVRWRSETLRLSPAELAIDGHIWAPRTYSKVAAGWLAEARLRPRLAGEWPPLVPRMTDLRPGTLAEENARLSGRLADAPLDPRGHEQAAFLLGVAAWREQAGRYQDLRPALSAMTAHLALATALRGQAGSPSAEGLLAEAMIEVLAERLVPARAVLESLGRSLNQPAERSWLRALALRAQVAPVALAPPADDSVLVQVEFARRLRVDAGGSALLGFVADHERAPATAWPRVVLAAYGGGVEAGNRFAETGVQLELEEARTLLGVLSDEPPAVVTAIRQALDAAGGRLGPGPRPQVASRAFWAAGAERQLLEMVGAHWGHLRHVLGLEAEARAVARQYAQWLEPLPLFPLLALQVAEERQEARPCEAVQQRLLARRPELVSAAHWVRSVGRCLALAAAGQATLPTAWFAPALPPGTAFDNEPRLRSRELALRLAPESVARLRELAPRSTAVIEAQARRVLGRAPTAADIREAWGEATDRSRPALLALLALDPQDGERLRLGARLCDLEAEQCLTYGNELARSDPDAAAVALERGLATARDRIQVANSTWWLVDYYLDNGRESDALRVAAESAETWSGQGLLTQARVFERLGRLEQAQAVYRRLQERYPTERALDCFHVRQAQRSPAGPYAQAGLQARQALFPKGLESKPIAAFAVIPSPRRNQNFFLDAERFKEGYRPLGAQVGDVVRAVHGYEIWNAEQYACARSLQDSDVLRLVVQRGRNLLELQAPFLRVKYGPVTPRR
ncbi:MAG: hypothetical protein NDJ94_05235 [Vicinamibacteria bacterium]|nr:hypothetical protein [Vicinamibacteria bacterium]